MATESLIASRSLARQKEGWGVSVLKIPTPLKGWRTFVGEVGVIVLGVLIALYAQQVVEHRSDRGRVDSALAALRPEVAYIDFNASESEITAPCVLAQIEAIQKGLASGEGGLLPRFSDTSSNGFVLRMPGRTWSDSVWQSVSASDIVRRLEPAIDLHLSSMFAQATNQAERVKLADGWVDDLGVLAVIVPTSEAERIRLISVTEHLRGIVQSIDLSAGQMRDSIAAAGLLASESWLDKELSESGTVKFCRAHGLPLGKLRPAIAANAE